MPINVGDALDSDTSEIITVIRTTGGYIDGIYVKNPPTTFKTIASAQQATPQELQVLSEGEREKSIFKFISKKRIFTVKDRDGLPADDIIFKGNRYKVISSGDWDSYGHTTVLGAKL